MARLRAEVVQSENIKSRVTRHAVTGALTSLLSALVGHPPSPNGLACFATDGKAWVLAPPSPVTSYLYRCEPRFVLEPLEDMVADRTLYGLVVMDYKEFTIGLLRGKRIEHLKTVQSGVMGKHGKGGQSAHRFERLLEQERYAFLKKTDELATSILTPLWATGRLQGILVGGPGMTKAEWVEMALPASFRGLVVSPCFDVGYTEEQGLRELVEAAGTVLRDTELVKEKAILNGFFAGMRTEKATYGLRAVAEALEANRAASVLLSEGVAVPEVVALAESKHVPAVTVSAETEEGERFRRMGGVAAILRY